MRFSSEVTEALLAQWLERAAVNRKVTGSIPVGSALFFMLFHRLRWVGRGAYGFRCEMFLYF